MSSSSAGSPAATTGALQAIPSRERETSVRTRTSDSATVATSQKPCCASYATTESLAEGESPGGRDSAVSEGRKPERQCKPASREVAKPIPDAPPSAIRPAWKVVTIVDPTAKLSGSTSVWCWPRTSANGSRES